MKKTIITLIAIILIFSLIYWVENLDEDNSPKIVDINYTGSTIVNSTPYIDVNNDFIHRLNEEEDKNARHII